MLHWSNRGSCLVVSRFEQDHVPFHPISIRCQALGTAAPITVQLDWWLWEVGERERDNHPPAHHTFTIYY